MFSKRNKAKALLMIYLFSVLLTPCIAHAQSDDNLVEGMQNAGWVRSTEKQLKKVFGGLVYEEGKNVVGIRSHDMFAGDSLSNTQKPTVLVLVHGTWAQETKGFFDPEKKFYGYVRDFAQNYAQKNQAPIEVISFRWSGNNSYKDRSEAASSLALLLNTYYSNASIQIIAHSHGSSVVNMASQWLDGITLDHIINIAAPVRETVEAEYRPMHFRRLTQFYSTSDMVAIAGAVTFNRFMPAIGSIHRFMPQENRTVLNIRTQINGNDTGHSSIKLLVRYLSAILDKIETNYQYNTDFDLDICFKTKQELEDLSKAAQDPVLIAIRRHPTLAGMFDREFKLNSSLKPDNKQQAYEFLRDFQKEIVYSTGQELAFLERYGTDIHQKHHLFHRVRHGITLEMAKMGTILPTSTTLALLGLGLGSLFFGYKYITKQAQPAVTA